MRPCSSTTSSWKPRCRQLWAKWLLWEMSESAELSTGYIFTHRISSKPSSICIYVFTNACMKYIYMYMRDSPTLLWEQTCLYKCNIVHFGVHAVRRLEVSCARCSHTQKLRDVWHFLPTHVEPYKLLQWFGSSLNACNIFLYTLIRAHWISSRMLFTNLPLQQIVLPMACWHQNNWGEAVREKWNLECTSNVYINIPFRYWWSLCVWINNVKFKQIHIIATEPSTLQEYWYPPRFIGICQLFSLSLSWQASYGAETEVDCCAAECSGW